MALRIMIVEDEPLIALNLETILEDVGNEVVGIAASMEAALRLALANPRLDLAIMDVQLTGGPDGVHTARRLREEYDVASLFVSASLTEEVRARALEWKPVGFLGKPFQEQDILKAISGLTPRSPPD